MDALKTDLTIPDLWQQKAINLLRAEYDVIVDAATGAGKTFIFEHLVEHTFPGKAVFTVPTRALANDKLREWQAMGWRVVFSPLKIDRLLLPEIGYSQICFESVHG